jgi:hypothetical protein
MTYDPNEQNSPSLWGRIWNWLLERDKPHNRPITLWQKPESRPEIHLSSEQQTELAQAMDQPCPNDTNFLPSDTSFRTRKAGSGAEKSVII